MTTPVAHSKTVGLTVQMRYLLANEWYTNPSLFPVAGAMTALVTFTAISSTVLYYRTSSLKAKTRSCFKEEEEHEADTTDHYYGDDNDNDHDKYGKTKKKKKNDDSYQDSIDTMFLWFNLSNAIIFSILVLLGWISKTFVLAELHNGLEVFMSIYMMLQDWKLSPGWRDFLSSRRLHWGLLILFGGLTLFQLAVSDLVLGAMVKGFGGVGDIIILATCLINLVRCFAPGREGRLTMDWCRQVFLNICCIAHATTVMITFFGCFYRDFQLVVTILGTALMNVAGFLYFWLSYESCVAPKFTTTKIIRTSLPASSSS